jgi:acetolactate synthase-1/3 small subunit
MPTFHTISAFTENSPGVLHRITAIFTRRKINIESLCVSETEQPGISRFTIGVKMDRDAVRKVVGQIRRIIEVVEVYAHVDEDLVFKELAFFKVKTETPKGRMEVEELAHRYGASMAYASKHYVVLEKIGTEGDVDSLYCLLEQFGIEEFVRSGRIAMEKPERPGGGAATREG